MNKKKQRLLKKVTEAMMTHHGYQRSDEQDIEWDHSRSDSQYSILYEDVEFLLQYLASEDVLSYEYQQELGPNKTVKQSSAIFIFMDSGAGNPTYVSDVRDWLAAVDKAGIPDDTELEGTLHLSYDVREGLVVERIECGDCGKSDIILNFHECQ